MDPCADRDKPGGGTVDTTQDHRWVRRTAEPVAGAVAWALARWATLRGAQPVRPKQADPITVGQDRSLDPHTHIIGGIHIIMPHCRRLEEGGGGGGSHLCGLSDVFIAVQTG